MAKGVGIYICQNEVIAVSAIRTAAGPRVAAFAVEPIDSEIPQEPAEGGEAPKPRKANSEAKAIFKVLAKIKEPAAFVNVAVNPLQVVTRHFIMPAVPKKIEAGAILHEAIRYIPFKLSDSVLDYHSYLTHKNVLSVTATAIRGEALQAYLQSLRAASAKVLMIEPVYNAAGRAFAALNMIGKTKTYGFVALQSNGNVNVTLTSQGIVYLSRDFLLNGKIEEDKKRFYEELKASMDYFYKLTGGEAIAQIFLAGSGDLKMWVEHLEHALNYTIRFDVANLPSAKNLPPEMVHTVLVAFGLALRSLGYRSPMADIQLLPKRERRSDPLQLLKFLAVECLAILILFAVLRFAIFQPQIQHLTEEDKTALSALKPEDRSAFASKTTEELAEEKGALTGRIGKLRTFFGDKIYVSDFLKALAQGTPQSISLDYVSLEDSAGSGKEKAQGRKGGGRRLNMKGFCYLGNAEKETAIVSSWLKSLAGKKVLTNFFGEIKLESIKREKVQNRDCTKFQIIGE